MKRGLSRLRTHILLLCLFSGTVVLAQPEFHNPPTRVPVLETPDQNLDGQLDALEIAAAQESLTTLDTNSDRLLDKRELGGPGPIPGAEAIGAFGLGRSYSSIVELKLPYDENGCFELAQNGNPYQAEIVWEYIEEPLGAWHGPFAGAATRVPNGNPDDHKSCRKSAPMTWAS